MADGQPKGPTINQVLDEFLAEQEKRLAPRTYRQYENVIDLLRYCLEDYVVLTDKKLEKAVDKARDAGAEDAVCSLCPPREIAGCISEFLGWFMVRKVVAGQDLMRAAGTVTRRLGRWLYEHEYIDIDDAEYFEEEGTQRGRALPKAKGLADRLAAWVENQPAVGSENTHESHFRIEAVTKRGWMVKDVMGHLEGDVFVPSELRNPQQVGWEVSGIIAETPRGLRWVEVWNVYP